MSSSDTRELAALVDEQARDMRFGHRVHSLSITEFIEHVIDGGGVFGIFLGSPHRYQRPPVPFVRPSNEARDFHQFREPVTGFCMAFVRLGPYLTGQVRCSRRASVGRFCKSHVKRRVGEDPRG